MSVKPVRPWVTALAGHVQLHGAACTGDCCHYDAFTDELATGEDIYAGDYLPPKHVPPLTLDPVEIPLRDRQGNVRAVTVIDGCDRRLSDLKWHLHPGGYVVRSPAKDVTEVYLHRVIMRPGAGMQVDHIDGDRLNNRRANLRVVTKAENCQNVVQDGGSSQYRGVSFQKASGKWTAQVKVNGVKRHLGTFEFEEEAAAAAAQARADLLPHTNETRHPSPTSQHRGSYAVPARGSARREPSPMNETAGHGVGTDDRPAVSTSSPSSGATPSRAGEHDRTHHLATGCSVGSTLGTPGSGTPPPLPGAEPSDTSTRPGRHPSGS